MSITGSLRLSIVLSVAAAVLLPSAIVGQQRTSDAGWPCKGTVDPAYVRSAEATGGVVLLLKPSELAGAAAEMRNSDRHDEVVFRAGGKLADGEYQLDVPVDSTIESTYFFVSVQCLRSVTLIRPTGDQLQTEEPGVESHRFEAVRLFTVPQPAPGLWQVRIAGRGFFSIVVKAATEVSLSDVTFSAGFPIKRQSQRLGVRMDGAVSDVAFHFVSSSGATIAPLPLQLEVEDDQSRTYAGEVTPPAGDFRVAMTGVDVRGFRLQRVDARLSVE
jgi:hypothetical protein